MSFLCNFLALGQQQSTFGAVNWVNPETCLIWVWPSTVSKYH